jgi:hypothetical protein
MTTIELLEKIKENLQKRRTALSEKMVQGRVSDFNSYHRDVGIALGLDQSCAIIDEALKKLNEEDV